MRAALLTHSHVLRRRYLTAQHYVCAAYFRPIDTLENQIFLRLIMDTFGTDYVVSDRMNSAHDSVRFVPIEIPVEIPVSTMHSARVSIPFERAEQARNHWPRLRTTLHLTV